MSYEGVVYDRDPFLVTSTQRPGDPFAVLYREAGLQSATLRTARPEELRQLLQHLERDPQEGELAQVVKWLKARLT